MKKKIGFWLVTVFLLCSCSGFNTLLKSSDYEYKYEAAKEYYTSGKYAKAASLLEELIAIMKGTDKGEESLYMLCMCYYGMGDYSTASHYFITYYNNYPYGIYTEEARFHSGKTLYLDVPEPRLDQTSTVKAIQELQLFLEYYPQSNRRAEIQQMLFDLQDNLVRKEYQSALLYYKLGPYFMNSGTNGGNNYISCIITAQNALRDYPYTSLREDLSILILRARYQMALQSVEDKMLERLRDTIDEYYAFKNEFPESKYMKEVEDIMKDVTKKEQKLSGRN